MSGLRSRALGAAFLSVAILSSFVAIVSAGETVAGAQGVTPSTGITITSGAVCSGTASGQTFPVSITLPKTAVNDKVDVSLLLDDTGSFSGYWPGVASTFSSVVSQLQGAEPTVTWGFGVSMFQDYGGPGNSFSEDYTTARPFVLNQPVVNAATAGGESQLETLISDAANLAPTIPGYGGDTPEASLEGLYQLASGAGFDGTGNGSDLNSGPAGTLATEKTPGTSGDIPPFSSNVATTSGTLGGMGWRTGALHIALLATDTSPVAAYPAGSPIPSTISSTNGDVEPSVNFSYAGNTPPGLDRTGYVANAKDVATNTVTGAVAPEGAATVQGTVNALNALGIRVMGMGPGDAPTSAEGPGDNSSSIWLSSMARLTGGTSSTGTPLVFSTTATPTSLAKSIVENVESSAGKPVNVGITASTLPTGVTVKPAPTTVHNVAPGTTAKFTVTITGQGSSSNGSFPLKFVDSTSGAQLGSIPVTIDCSAATPKEPTSVTTTLSGGGKSGTSISVPAGTPVTDTSTLSGTNATSATGTVTYTVYSNSACTTVVNSATEKISSAGSLPASSPVTLSTAGTYYWEASYSGDPTNEPSASICGAGGEVATVVPATTETATSLSGGGKTGTNISVPTGTAVTDQASLSGVNASKATGSVTYTVYSNAACTTPVGTSTTKNITTPGVLPASNPVTLGTAGAYYWKASYSGDGANTKSTSPCGTSGEVETVKTPSAAPTKVTTSLSGGGKTGASISVPTGTPVTDQATLSGTHASTATGTVTYTVYSNAACTTPVGPSTTQPITTPGKLPASSPVTLTTPGTYYWQASYSGDSANAKSTSPCGTSGEVETVTSPTVKREPTKLRTSLSGKGIFGGGPCWWLGDSITVFAGAQVTDSATLSGPNSSKAGGTVTYTVYALVKTKKCPRHGQWEAVASGGTVTVTNGSVPNSKPVTLPVGTYEWQASYSGDSLNAPSTSPFGSETETVIPTPKCGSGWNLGFDPCCKVSIKHH